MLSICALGQIENKDKRFISYYDNYPVSIIERIKSRSMPNSNGCLEYRSGKLKHKYGLISITINGNSKLVPAHRAMWMAVNGKLDLPRNIYIRHKCDNPYCVNVEHLEPGTAKDNHQDMLERGRNAKAHKLHTRLRKFTNDQILQIRAATGKLKWIAEEFGTTSGYVSKLRNMKAKTLV